MQTTEYNPDLQASSAGVQHLPTSQPSRLFHPRATPLDSPRGLTPCHAMRILLLLLRAQCIQALRPARSRPAYAQCTPCCLSAEEASSVVLVYNSKSALARSGTLVAVIAIAIAVVELDARC